MPLFKLHACHNLAVLYSGTRNATSSPFRRRNSCESQALLLRSPARNAFSAPFRCGEHKPLVSAQPHRSLTHAHSRTHERTHTQVMGKGVPHRNDLLPHHLVCHSVEERAWYDYQSIYHDMVLFGLSFTVTTAALSRALATHRTSCALVVRSFY